MHQNSVGTPAGLNAKRRSSLLTWLGLLTERIRNSLGGDFPALCHPVSCRAGLVRRPSAYTDAKFSPEKPKHGTIEKCQSHGEVQGPRTGVEVWRRHIQAHQASPLDFRNSFRYSIIRREAFRFIYVFAFFRGV